MNAEVRPSAELQLKADIYSFYDDPLAYALYVWPWGEPGTRLEEFPEGPDTWQREVMNHIRDSIRADPEGFQVRDATASGHGIGKGALSAMITHWFHATRWKPAGVTTANTQSQLRGKTMRELSIWNADAINGHWFEWTATKFQRVGHESDWYQDAVPNTEHNSQSFAGLHGTEVLVIFDEASTIPQKIFEVTEGAFSTPRNLWLLFGNPTENSGAFRDVFGKNRKFWNTRHVDSRTARMATLRPSNMEKFKLLAEQYGEDSDFFRVRVLGQFPSQASTQFIPRAMVEAAQANEELPSSFSPKIMALDVARYGDDANVIARVHGRKLYPMNELRKHDLMAVSDWMSSAINRYKPDIVFVDGVGVGGGVVDRLRQLGHPIIEVNAGAMPSEEYKDRVVNKRAEMFYVMREWLKTADIPEHDAQLAEELTTLQYDYDPTRMRLRLQSKEDLKKLGYSSPDRADALAMCFAQPVPVAVVTEDTDPPPEEDY